MKKFLIAMAALLSAGFVFAESYTVKSVTGKVTLQAGSDKWVEVTAGKSLSSANVINTNLNSFLVLTNSEGKEINIKANQKGTVDVLVNAALNPSAGIKKAKITVSSVAGATQTNSKGTATASSRASEAKEDIDWDE